MTEVIKIGILGARINQVKLPLSIFFVLTAFTVVPLAVPARSDEVPAGQHDRLLKEQESGRELELANGLIERGLYRLAEKELKDFLASQPSSQVASQARLLLVVALKEQGKNTEALQLIRETRARDIAASLRAKLNLLAGEIQFNLKEYEEASRYFRILLSAENSEIQETAMYFLGQCYARDGLDKNAAAVYRQLAHKDFEDQYVYRPYAAYELTKLYRKQGDFKSAEELYDKLLDAKNVPPALQVRAGLEAGEFAVEQGSSGKAEKYFSGIIDGFPSSDAARTAYEQLARLYLADEEPQKTLQTIAEYQRERGLEPEDYRLAYLRAVAYLRQQDFEKALGALERIIESGEAEDINERHRQLALQQSVFCLLRLERYDKAIAKSRDFEEDFSDASDFPDVLFYRGLAHYRLKNFSSALETFLQARHTVEQPDDWKHNRASLEYIADCYNEQKDYKEEAEVYQQLLELAEEQEKATLHLAAANAFQKAGETEKAKAEYRNVLELQEIREKEREEAVYKLVRIWFDEDEFAQAERLLAELSQSLQSMSPDLQILLGYSRYKLGNYGEAKESLRTLIEDADKGSEEVIARAEYLLGSILFEEKKTEEALEVFNTLISKPEEIRPAMDKSLLLRLAELYFERDEFSRCQAFLEEIIPAENRGLHYEAMLLKAELLMVMNKHPETIELLRELITEYTAEDVRHPGMQDLTSQQNPDLSEAYSLLGEALLEEEQGDEAIYNFRRAIQSQSASSTTAARAYWGMAEIFQNEGRWEDALSQAINGFIIVDHPYYTPRCMLIAVKALTEIGEHEEAETTWDELEKRFPAFAQKNKTSDFVREIKE
ncbi:MAG: tetratricopeptide repeat protein [Lentisphaeria bacterium]